MTHDPVAVHVESPVKDILGTMEEYNVRRVPVLSEGTVVGTVSRADLVRALIRRTPMTIWRFSISANASAGSMPPLLR